MMITTNLSCQIENTDLTFRACKYFEVTWNSREERQRAKRSNRVDI